MFGSVELLLSFADLLRQVKHKFYVVNVKQAVLGMDALRSANPWCLLRFGNKFYFVQKQWAISWPNSPTIVPFELQ